MRTVIVKDLGTIDYMECWKLQQEFFEKLVAGKTGHSKKNDDKASEQALLLCEHPHVYTLGRSGSENNLLIDPAFMERIGATYYRVDRGGDITYHGPGQLVGYPILDLEQIGMGLKDYVNALEDAIIATVARFGIEAGRSKGATGVWLKGASPRVNKERDNKIIPFCGSDPCRGNERKIAAIGVRSSRFVTMHGFALNVNTALEYFSYINPCGFTDKGVTSMARELGKEMEIERVKRIFVEEFARVFGERIRFIR